MSVNLTAADLAGLEDEMRREVSMRRTVFARQVEAGKMRREVAELRIAQAERLVTLLEALQQPGARLLIGEGTAEAFYLRGRELVAWLADPAAYVVKARAERRAMARNTREGQSGTAREAPSADSGQSDDGQAADFRSLPRHTDVPRPASAGGGVNLFVHATAREARDAQEARP